MRRRETINTVSSHIVVIPTKDNISTSEVGAGKPEEEDEPLIHLMKFGARKKDQPRRNKNHMDRAEGDE